MRIAIGDTEHDFDPDKVRNDEAMAIERALGCSYKAWSASLADGSASALTALVWILERRTNPGLRFDDVRFELGAVRPIQDTEVAEGPTEPATLSSPGD